MTGDLPPDDGGNPDSWHAKACRTFPNPDPPTQHRVCALVNQSDAQPTLKQGLLRLNDGLLSGAIAIWVDYVRLERDGSLVDWATVNVDQWLDTCDTCTPDFVSTSWDGTVGSHTWQAKARFRFKWSGNGGISGYYTLNSGLWTP